MASRRRTDPSEGRAAVLSWRADPRSATPPTLATAVRFTLEELAERAPGHAVEVRVPPFGVTQCLQGPRHARGTPANVIETDGRTWLELATGVRAWDEAVAAADVTASGERADLSGVLPLL